MVLFSLLLAMAVLLVAGPSQAAEKLVPKVDSFVIFLDHSGSMGMTHGKLKAKKIDLAVKAIQGMLGEVPELGYQAGVYTFAPYKQYQAPTTYSWADTGAAVAQVDTSFDIFKRLTPMGDGMEALDPTVSQMPKKTAIILVTDGLSNVGKDPVAVAESLYSKYGGDVCFHIISLAEKEEGQATLDKIAALNSCTCGMLDIKDALNEKDQSKLKDFIECIFYDRVMIEEAKPVPAPAPTPTEEVIVFRSVNFDFDKANIRPDMEPVLDEAAAILQQNDKPVVLEGHTCWIGPEAYNQGLSERRAASVKDYLVKKGVDSGRLSTVGYGETRPKYDNNTREGRALNRRVEIHLQ